MNDPTFYREQPANAVDKEYTGQSPMALAGAQVHTGLRVASFSRGYELRSRLQQALSLRRAPTPAQARRPYFLAPTSAIPAPSSEKAAGINTNPGGTTPSDSNRSETDW